FCPPGSDLGCNPASFPPAGEATATDNCGEPEITSVLGDPVQGQGCLWSRTRTYTATDACGNTATCTQVFTYTLDIVPPDLTCPGNIIQWCPDLAIPGPTYSDNCTAVEELELEYNFNGAGFVPATSFPIIMNDMPAGTYTMAYRVTDECGNIATCNFVIQITYDCEEDVDFTVNGGNPVFCGMVNNTLAAAIHVPYSTVSWEVIAGDWVITGPKNTPAITFKAMSSTYATFRITIFNPNGCDVSCEVSIPCEEAWQHCSLTQGFYGNQTGKFCGTPGVELVTGLLSTDLIIGRQGRSYTVNHWNAQCIDNLLPSGGPSAILAAGDNGCGYGTQPAKNTLFGQGLTLGLNMRLDPMLPGVALTTSSWLVADNSTGCGSVPTATKFEDVSGVPSSVFNYLQAHYHSTPTVNDLLDLVNDALGGHLIYPNPPSLSNIGSAAGAINEAFDECVWVQDMGGLLSQSDDPFNEGASGKFTISLNAFPNPFVESTTIRVIFSQDVNATIDVYTLIGTKVATIASGPFTGKRTYDLVFTPETSISEATYMVLVRTDEGNKLIRIIHVK
ncbi:MAG TPA: T9SS type A sorting domain-containing protein, partial [Bacteroidales bacterium]|nr:T9SS type A sorting domain-containing protein [Bacteroidales bacterium]